MTAPVTLKMLNASLYPDTRTRRESSSVESSRAGEMMHTSKSTVATIILLLAGVSPATLLRRSQFVMM